MHGFREQEVLPDNDWLWFITPKALPMLVQADEYEWDSCVLHGEPVEQFLYIIDSDLTSGSVWHRRLWDEQRDGGIASRKTVEGKNRFFSIWWRDASNGAPGAPDGDKVPDLWVPPGRIIVDRQAR